MESVFVDKAFLVIFVMPMYFSGITPLSHGHEELILINL